MAFNMCICDESTAPLQLMDDARDWLAEKGYDPAYGARPLKRVIQKNVQDPLAQLILAAAIKDGDTVPVHAGPDGLQIADVAVVSERPKSKRALN